VSNQMKMAKHDLFVLLVNLRLLTQNNIALVATHCLLQQWSHRTRGDGDLKAKREGDDVDNDEGCVNQQQDEEDMQQTNDERW
jgi:hypothetical protein